MPFWNVKSDTAKLPPKLLQALAEYIDAHFVDTRAKVVYAAEETREIGRMPSRSPMAPCASMPAPKVASLEDMLLRADAGFTETLLKRIDKTGKKDAEIYKKANISKQHFSKIRNNPHYQPTKPTAIALALALELSLEETRDLIGRAGFALTNSSKFDLIVQYFIENKNYNIVEINMALYEFDQPLLGA